MYAIDSTNDIDEDLAQIFAKICNIESTKQYGSITDKDSVWGRACVIWYGSLGFDNALNLKTKFVQNPRLHDLVLKYQKEKKETVRYQTLILS